MWPGKAYHSCLVEMALKKSETILFIRDWAAEEKSEESKVKFL